MAQDTTPAILMYEGDGSNNEFSIAFDKGYYGEVKVAYVRRGLTDYEYAPTTYTVSGAMYAWVHRDEVQDEYIYTKTPTPAVGTHTFDSHGIDTENDITAVSGQTITVGDTTYTRNADGDFEQNAYLTWTGETLEQGDWICIVRETEMGQPYVFPNNQKHIEDALDNIERQVQELKASTDRSVKVDMTKTDPITWMNTVVRSMDNSVLGLKYANGWLCYSCDNPDTPEEDKTWVKVLNTSNIKNIYYQNDHTETGDDLFNVYYEDDLGVTRLMSIDPVKQDARIGSLETRMTSAESDIETERYLRDSGDAELRALITSGGTIDPEELEAIENTLAAHTLTIQQQGNTINQHTALITQNSTNIADNTSDISDLEATVGQHTTAIAQNATDISGLSVTVAGHTTTLGQQAATLADHTTTLGQHTSAISAQGTDISDIKSKINNAVTASNQMMPKSYIDDKVTSIYHIQGVKETFSQLPTTGNTEGDCWMITTADATHSVGSYVWVLNQSLPEGGEWQFLGDTFDTTNFATFSDLSDTEDTLNARITSEVATLNSTITTKETALNTRITNEVATLNQTITSDVATLNNTITSKETALNNRITSEVAALNETITSDVNTINGNMNQMDTDLRALIASKQHNMAAGNNITITPGVNQDTISMDSPFGKKIQINATTGNLELLDQNDSRLGADVPLDLGIGVDATYSQEDISFSTARSSTTQADHNAIADIVSKIPAGTNSTTNKLVNQNQLNLKANTADLAAVAFSGSYSDLVDEPTNVSYFTNDAGYQNATQVSGAIATHNTANNAHSNIINPIITSVDSKVSKVSTANKVYGTDSTGAQTTYDKNSFGQVDDVKVNGTSVVSNKVASITLPSVIDNLTSTSTTDALSANQGKALNDRLESVEGRGRYLSTWDCTTGLAGTNPPTSPYQYKSGDYFTVSVVGTTNYRPNGSSYTTGVASTTVETASVQVNDVYAYDGTNWILQQNTQREVTFSSLAGDAYDNTSLATALNAKAAATDLSTHTQDTNNPHSVTKAQVGLGNVDNTSDFDKPVSTAMSIALSTKQEKLTAGKNIVIRNQNIIDCLATSYTAGDNIVITGTLPTGYTQVLYVDKPESASSLYYIDTGHAYNSTSVITLKATSAGTGVPGYLAGSGTDIGASDAIGFTIDRSNIGGIIGSAGYASSSANDYETVVIDIPNRSLIFNGTLVGNTYNPSPNTTLTAYLFAFHRSTGAHKRTYGRIYGYTQVDNGVPVVDLIPCKNSSNVYGFYDVVNNTFLTCNGLTGGPEISTATISATDSLPSQSGQSGKFLTTNGSDASWATVDALPSQSGQSGKFLTTNGSDASWATVSQMTATYDATTKTITFA